jgi:hypothetical protein
MTMAECEKYIEQISALVDAELSDEEEAAVLEHIAECQDCHAVYESFCEIVKCMPQITVEPPSKLKDSIMHNIRAEAKARKPRPSVFRYVGLAAVSNTGSTEAPSLSVESAEIEDSSGAYMLGAPNVSDIEECDTEKGYARSISDMRCFINYLESISPEEYTNAVDDYEGELYAVLVLEGEVPVELRERDKLLENKNEIFLGLSREEIESLSKNSDDSLLIMNDEDANKGLVIIKKDEE